MTPRAGLPLARLALLLGASLLLSLAQSWIPLAVAGGLLVTLALALGLPRGLLRLLTGAAALGLPFLFLLFLLSGREATGTWRSAPEWGLRRLLPYALRIGDLVLANLIFIRTTSLAELMGALKGLHLSGPAVLFFGTVLRFIPQSLLETRRVMDAQRCRGLTQRKMFTPSGFLAISVPLFLSQIHRSRDLAVSLEIRSSAFSSRRPFKDSTGGRLLDPVKA